MITLRPYQLEAVEAAWEALSRGAHPVIKLDTGAGKSLVIAELAKRIYESGSRVIIATHNQELVAQNAKEFEQYSGIEPGILCAGLERTDKGHDVLFASVQSLYRPVKRDEIPPVSAIIIDECHLVSEKGSDAKFYPALFDGFPDAQRVGLSATPFRMDGPVYGENRYFTEKCYATDILDLVKAGYLCPLVGVTSNIQLDVSKVKSVAGEFDQKQVEHLETEAWLVSVAKNVIELSQGRKHIAVFCPTVKVAETAANIFTKLGMVSGVVVSDTEDRDDVLTRWKAGVFPVMCSVNVLNTGFNFKALDCIVCLRPTESLALWLQICGRGTRLADGKKNCLLLDYSSNLSIHGGISAGMEEVYVENEEGEISRRPATPKPRVKLVNKVASLTDIDPMIATSKGIKAEVESCTYNAISSKAAGVRMVIVNYKLIHKGFEFSASQFVCVEHRGWARNEAVKWFEARGVTDVPFNADAARYKCYSLPVPREVTVRKNGKYLNVIAEKF